jgi:hypothetical protein
MLTLYIHLILHLFTNISSTTFFKSTLELIYSLICGRKTALITHKAVIICIAISKSFNKQIHNQYQGYKRAKHIHIHTALAFSNYRHKTLLSLNAIYVGITQVRWVCVT